MTPQGTASWTFGFFVSWGGYPYPYLYPYPYPYPYLYPYPYPYPYLYSLLIYTPTSPPGA